MLAVVQTDVKRMMAYSSINHAGFVLVGVQVATEQGVQAALFYLATYTFLIAGTFGVITLVGRKGDGHHSLDDYKGLGRSRPGLALLLAVFLFAQAGVPLTSGFFAKFYVITAAVDGGSAWLAIVAMLSSVISAFLYLRITVSLYMGDPDEEAAAPPRHPGGRRHLPRRVRVGHDRRRRVARPGRRGGPGRRPGPHRRSADCRTHRAAGRW